MKGVQLQVCGKGFWRGNLKERDNLEDLALDGVIKLKPCIKLITYDTYFFLRFADRASQYIYLSN